jgi:hypothetical protein
MLATNPRPIRGALWQCHPKPHAGTYCYSYTYSYANTDGNSYSHSNGDGYTYSHCQA